MALRFTVLASGSSGNATLLEAAGCGVLIDAGLGPRQLASRMTAAGRSWGDVHSVLLSHTHSDHWKDASLAHLRRRRICFHCHPGHASVLSENSLAFGGLLTDGLVRTFEAGQTIELGVGFRCRPLPIRHDSGPTFAFRFEADGGLFGCSAAVGYAADLGSWDDCLAEGLADVDLLAVEFNHDVHLERSSGRMPRLIARVLGDEGHLSNVQAAGLVRAVLDRSSAGRLRYLVQLHLSRDCNRPALAQAAALAILKGDAAAVTVQTAEQHFAGSTFHLTPWLGAGSSQPRASRRTCRSRKAVVDQRWLPGLSDQTQAGEVG